MSAPPTLREGTGAPVAGPRGGRGVPRRLVGALIGLLSAALALGVGETVAAFVRPEASPLIAVGNRVVLLTPESVKRWATTDLGTSDKSVLITGVLVVLGLLSIAVGMLALRRLVFGLAGLAVVGAFGAYCALTDHAGRGTDVVPVVVGVLVAGAMMTVLQRSALGHPAPRTDPDLEGGQDTVPVQARTMTLADRRAFLQAGVASAGLAAVTGFGGRALQHARFDVSEARAKIELPAPVSGVPTTVRGADLGRSGQPWVTPNSAFYRIDTALTVPQIEPSSWSLRIHGMVEREISLSYKDLLARPMIERWITLCCVSNPVGGSLIGNARFLGVRLADLLREAGVHAGSDQLLMTSQDGMTIGSPTQVLMDGRDALVAVGMNGAPLPIAHGFPARIVVPGLYGYVSACKWVVELEATTYDANQAFWTQQGWSPAPPLKLESRIDTPRSGKRLTAGSPAAIAGVAWDQHVGVSTVEVQVDDGPWTSARLAAVPSTDTWRQWVLPWTPPRRGTYRLRVRATDAHGQVQTTSRATPFPSGATGLHTVTVTAA